MFLGSRSIKVNNRHINYIFQIITKLFLHFGNRSSPFHYNLFGSSGFLHKLINLIKVKVCLIQIYHDFSFSMQQCLFQSRHFVNSTDITTISQIQLTNITQCVFRNQSFSGSSTIQCAVVHKNQFAVFRFLNIQLNNVYSHFNSVIYCFQRIFRKITPISTMSHYNYRSRIATHQLFTNLRNMILC